MTGTNDETAETPALAPQRDFIGGGFHPPSGTRIVNGEEQWIEHASNGQRVQRQTRSGDDAVERTIQSAWSLHRSGELAESPEHRAAALDAMAASLQAKVGSVARSESIGSGATIGITSMFGFILHGAFTLAAAQIRDGVLSERFDGPTGRAVEVDRLPWGPALALCPWNAPAPMAAHKVASALAAGCPVIIKPPERVPHGSEAICEAAHEAGLADGAVQLVHGGPDVATMLMTDERIRAVSFTGGIVGGRAVAHACAEGLKPAQLELGGHSPLIVLDDADPRHVAEAAIGLMTTINGQWCRALGRLLLPVGRADEYTEAIIDALGNLIIGDPLDPATQMGPICHSGHLETLQAQVAGLEALGGTVHRPSALPERRGNWMSPTLVTGLDPLHSTHEIFGPVASVHRYGTLDEAIEIANGTDYGLEAYIVGMDEDLAMSVGRRVRAGGIKVNGVSPVSLNLMAPRPAFGVSGLAEEGTAETIRFFGGNRVLGVEASLGAGAG